MGRADHRVKSAGPEARKFGDEAENNIEPT
jgi:hypothetical protein